ncbi:hypothetical protein D0T49_06870 [Paludibacter sp. 221]|uniref:hypothetical protein n=1 Tax=Paludibacter sp. 221 TaxID=2302939 RepID=UPI0013D2D1AD|nr:hypothetical protein [Paludibacter sp. 221]NDV46766.1 hypothetical protein [Paludibacter sp. 221]
MKKTILFVIFSFLVCTTFAQITRGQLFKLFHEAQTAQHEERIGDAIVTYNKIADAVPNLPQPHLALGVLYSVDSEYQDVSLALESYKKYLLLVPYDYSTDSIRAVVDELEKEIALIQQMEEEALRAMEEDEDSVILVEIEEEFPALILEEDPMIEEAIAVLTEELELQKENLSDEVTVVVRNFAIPNKWRKTTQESIVEIKGKIIEKQKRQFVVATGDDEVSIPLSKVLVIMYADGTNSTSDVAKLESIAGMYYEAALDLYKKGERKKSAELFTRALEFGATKDDILKTLGKIYSHSTNVETLRLSQSYLQSYLDKIGEDSEDYLRAKDRLEYVNERIGRCSKRDREHEKFLRKHEGTWIADYSFKGNKSPLWAFNIRYDEEPGIEMHRGCRRYSEELYSRFEFPVMNDENKVSIRFTNGDIYMLSDSELNFFEKNYLDKVTNPQFLYTTATNANKAIMELYRGIESGALHLQDHLKKDKKNCNTLNEFIIEPVSDNMIRAKCIETVENKSGDTKTIESSDTIKTCRFYKIPENYPVVFIGEDMHIISGGATINQLPFETVSDMLKEYNKYVRRISSGKECNYATLKYPFHTDEALCNHLRVVQEAGLFEWYSREKTKNSLKWVGGLALSSASVVLSLTGLGGITNDLVTALSDTMSKTGVTSQSIKSLNVDPAIWNNKMFSFMLEYNAM